LEVEAALESWVEPVNCVLAADTTGDVRQLVAGKVPVRNPENRVRPVPAWSREHQWTGEWVDLPRSGVASIAVNANDRGSGGGERTGLEFAPAHRARRIRHLLEEAGSGLDVDAMQLIHMDTMLGSWPAFRALLDGLDGLPEAADELRRQLLGWDGHMHADSEEAALFAAWRSGLVLALTRSTALEPLTAPHGRPPLFAPWLDAAARVGFAVETILAQGTHHGLDADGAARQSLNDLAAAPPAGLWGSKHTLLPLHALADFPSTGAAAPVLPVTTLSGDTTCVLSTESLPGITDGSFRGPVARYAWDLADRTKSRWIVPFGASGNPHSKHFSSQLPHWAAGQLIPVVTDWDQLTKENHDPR
jgi:penicillin amidase